MSTKQAVREVAGRWVPVAEEPRWVALKAERVQEPPVFGAGKVEPYSAAYELLYCHNELVTFDLAALRTVITIQPAKGAQD
jgi:hypothetical protein